MKEVFKEICGDVLVQRMIYGTVVCILAIVALSYIIQ